MSNAKKFYIASFITYIVALFSFISDQVTKQLISNSFNLPRDVTVFGSTFTIDLPHQYTLALHESRVITDWLYYTYVVNYGAAFSSFYGQTLLLSLFAGIISAGIIVYERMTHKKRTKLLSFSMGFLLGGALGNLVDRVRLGFVVDFFDLRNNGDNIWPIFNIADISINIGIGLLILYYIFQEKYVLEQEQKAKASPDEDEEIPLRSESETV